LIPVAIIGRPVVWMSLADPIWASGQASRVKGRTHDRIEPTLVSCKNLLEPYRPPTHGISLSLAAAWANRCERLGSVRGWQRHGGGTGLLRESTTGGSTMGGAMLDAGRLISELELVDLLIRLQDGGQVRGNAVAKAEIRFIFAECHCEGDRIEYASFRECLRWIFIVTDDDGADRDPVEAWDAIQGVVGHPSGCHQREEQVPNMFLATFQ
jgi:hypothetical protein